MDPVEAAVGVVRVADAEMTRALRVISVERGLDPRTFALVAFGGAGPLHACSLAEELGIPTVLVPPASGVLSALGLAVSELRRDYLRPAGASFEELEDGAERDLPGCSCERFVDARYRGQSYELTVPAEDYELRFGEEHARRYGFRMEDEVELVSVRLVATLPGPSFELRADSIAHDARRRRAFVDGEWVEIDVHGPGVAVAGPAIIELPESTCLVRPGWAGAPDDRDARPGAELMLDPVTLSVMTSALAGVAEETGVVLIRSAYSSNIKERRDCSAGLFDARGRMVAQAEHIPVHLGAMPESVAAVIEQEPRPGDTFILNDPFAGGSHLPDVTMVSPLSIDGEVVAYALHPRAPLGHRRIQPGSMPAGSTEIWQEGMIVPPVLLTDDVLRLVLANVRTPRIRQGDLAAQAAAGRLAEERLRDLVARHGLELVLAAFDEVIAYAERRAREAIRRLPDGRYTAESEVEGDGVVDDDLPIRVAVSVAGDSIEIDFEGTAGAARGNVNCPLSVTRSASLFAVKTLLPADVPANAGAYAPVTVRAPEGSLVNAQRPSAVVAGNVETSQRIADTVLLALAQVADLPAQGQGTMNNVVLGTSAWTYYETIGGGQGASSRGPDRRACTSGCPTR